MAQVLWKTAFVTEEDAEAMARAANVPVKIARWLCIRGIHAREAQAWLTPTAGVYQSPMGFLDMNRAVQRIGQAIRQHEKIAVVGDYDVDGVTASAILASTLQLYGADYVCDIPHRIEDGYGLSDGIVERLSDRDVGLLITVDNGIRSLEAIDLAVRKGMAVIVTDHHEPGPALPEHVAALVHWSRVSEGFDLNHLSGAGVALKLSEALLQQDGLPQVQSGVAEHKQWIKGLAALGALADVMPMRVENRRLVLDGLQYLKTSSRPGWQALCEIAGVDKAEITDRTALWRITPRLNAAGRMDSAELAFELLMAESPVQAKALAQNLEKLNQYRRSETDKAVREAELQCQGMASDLPAGLVVSGPWPQGVIGIVAARLVDVYQRPVIVFAETGGEVLKGSGRSIDGMSLYQALEKCSHTLHHFGGHDAAVGCGVTQSELESFRSCFAAVCAQLLASEGSASSTSVEETPLTADDYLPLADATLETLQWVNQFAPYGPDNPPLRFYVGPLEVTRVDMVGRGHHARLRVAEGNVKMDMIWFNAPDGVEHWGNGQLIGAVVELESNTWRNVTKPQLRVVEARRLRRALTKMHFGALYRLLRARRQIDREDAQAVLPEAQPEDIRTVMDVFVELGFAQCRESAYHVVEQVTPRDLRESLHYHNHLIRAIVDVQA